MLPKITEGSFVHKSIRFFNRETLTSFLNSVKSILHVSELR